MGRERGEEGGGGGGERDKKWGMEMEGERGGNLKGLKEKGRKKD